MKCPLLSFIKIDAETNGRRSRLDRDLDGGSASWGLAQGLAREVISISVTESFPLKANSFLLRLKGCYQPLG